jgi:hypothetical protein
MPQVMLSELEASGTHSKRRGSAAASFHAVSVMTRMDVPDSTSWTAQTSFPTIAHMFSDGPGTIQGGAVANVTSLWGSGNVTVNTGSTYFNGSGSTFALSLLTSGTLALGSLTTGFTSQNCGTFTNNGVTQVDTPPAAGHWPANSLFSFSLNTVGGTACGTGGPYFSAAVTQDNLFTKAVTANCNDVYNYCAQPASVSITAANLDLFNGLHDPYTGAVFANSQ